MTDTVSRRSTPRRPEAVVAQGRLDRSAGPRVEGIAHGEVGS
jgi:hypothetical protein